MLDFARSLTLPSAGRYLAWRASGRKHPIPLRTRTGAHFEMRPTGFGQLRNNDYGVAYEVFVHDLYRPAMDNLNPNTIHLVVDLGANVGLATLSFLHSFPLCRVIAFEPHPGHAAQAQRNFKLDGSSTRVELIEAASGAHKNRVVLSDKGSGSTVTQAGAGISVRIVDIFSFLGHRRIDLLKIDIEGGEYEIMNDPRFFELDVGAIIMEWHKREDKGLSWCLQRLESANYVAEAFATEGDHGMIWAQRRRP